MCKCKQNLSPPVFFVIFLLTEQKPNMCSKMKILFKNLYAEQILVSIAFHTVDPTWNKIVISKNLTFSDSNSLRAYKREFKRFLLSIELNDLEIFR